MKTPSKGFVKIPNDMFKSGLSLKAIGLYGYIKGKAPGWEFHTKAILKAIKEGSNSFRSGLKELIDKGYITSSIKRDEKGQVYCAIYQTNDYPAQVYQTSENQTLDNHKDIYKKENKTEEEKEEMRLRTGKLIHDTGKNMSAKTFY